MAVKLSSDNIIDYIGPSLFLKDYSLIFFQLYWFLSSQLKQNGFTALSCKLLQNWSREIAIVEWEKEGSWNCARERFDVELFDWFHFQSNIAGQIIDDFVFEFFN